MSLTRITVQNRTGRPLVPYLMVDTSVGRRRLAQAALTVPAGGSYELDPCGGDPVFFDPLGSPLSDDQPTRSGVLVELPAQHEPKVLSSTVFGYSVAPDVADGDPAHAPLQRLHRECRLAPATTAVTISLGSDFSISFDEHGGTLAASS